MGAALQMAFSFDQILTLVRQLPLQEKIRLSRELEKEGIQTTLESLLATFRTDELSLDILDEAVEAVRQQLYDAPKV